MRRILNQKGFSAIEVAVFVIVMGLVGGTGAYVVNANNNAKQDSAEVTTKIAKTEVQKKPETVVDTNEYLIMKEWNIKLPLTDEIKSADYRYTKDIIYLGVSNLGGYCSAHADEAGGMGGIIRYKAGETNPTTGNKYESESTSDVKLGSYYYRYIHSQAACTEDEALNAKELAANSALVEQMKKLEAATN